MKGTVVVPISVGASFQEKLGVNSMVAQLICVFVICISRKRVSCDAVHLFLRKCFLHSERFEILFYIRILYNSIAVLLFN